MANSSDPTSVRQAFVDWCDKLTVPQTRKEWRAIEQALAAPFHPDEVQFRKGGRGDVLAYVDRTVVARRLNDVVGAENWTYEPVVLMEQGGKVTVVKGLLTICGVTKASIGDAEADGIEPNKAADSDGLKRAADLWGVGAYLRELNLPRLALPQAEGDLRKGLAEGQLWASAFARAYYEGLCGGLGRRLASAAPTATVRASDSEDVQERGSSSREERQERAEEPRDLASPEDIAAGNIKLVASPSLEERTGELRERALAAGASEEGWAKVAAAIGDDLPRLVAWVERVVDVHRQKASRQQSQSQGRAS